MPMLQETWATKPLPGIVGRRANMEEWNTITRIAEEAGIGFGVPVQRGTADDHIEPLAADGNFLGITEADQSLVDGQVGTALEYAEGVNVPVCEKGVIWVRAGGTVAAGGLVYFAASSSTYFGAAAGGRVLVPGAEFDSSGSADSLVKVRLRRQTPVPAPAGGGD